LSVLPDEIQKVADHPLEIQINHQHHNNNTNNNNAVVAAADSSSSSFVCYSHWPQKCTLRGWLTYCVDIHSLPKREDLWALSHCCSNSNNDDDDETTTTQAQQQRDKIAQSSDTTGSALYTDYAFCQKRSWADVLYDFDSLRTTKTTANGGFSLSSLSVLLSLLSPMRPQEFSTASAPTMEIIHDKRQQQKGKNSLFGMNLCVAVVEGTTPSGRAYDDEPIVDLIELRRSAIEWAIQEYESSRQRMTTNCSCLLIRHNSSWWFTPRW
jgi:hypothetical protein